MRGEVWIWLIGSVLLVSLLLREGQLFVMAMILLLIATLLPAVIVLDASNQVFQTFARNDASADVASASAVSASCNDLVHASCSARTTASSALRRALCTAAACCSDSASRGAARPRFEAGRQLLILSNKTSSRYRWCPQS